MTDDDKALVERLRDGVLYGDARLHNPKGHDPLRMEAADRIEALSAENERLRRDHAALAKQLDIAQRKLKGVTKQWHADRAALGDTK